MTRAENLDKFFGADGKTVILPIDHNTAVPVAGLEKPGDFIEAMNPHVDGYVVNLGLAISAMEQLADKGICLRTDVYKPANEGHTDEGSYRIFGGDDAETIGAHAMMNMLYPNHSNESGICREAAELISESMECDIPVILESLPYGLGRPDDYTVENINFAARAASEIGSDIVKTAFPTGGSVDDFRKIVDNCIVPVIILGGAAMGDDEALLSMVKKAMDGGASGIAVGRNVIQHPDPPKIAAALHAIVHDGAGVESALKLVS